MSDDTAFVLCCLEDRSSTHGFWNPLERPSQPRLIEGDVTKFRADCQAAARRANERIRRYESERRRIVAPELWQEWWFDQSIWNVSA